MVNEETLYARYLSGELTPEEKALLEENGDREKLETVITMTDRFTLPPVDKKAGFDKLVTGRRNRSNNNVRTMPIYRWISGVAAAILIAIGIYLFTSNDIVSLQSDYATTMEHQFDEGSMATLNAGATLTFDRKNWNRNRNVELQGEAFFEVEKGAPFEVKTSIGTVQVLGTSFNVRSYDDIMQVECFEGKVKVSANDIDKILTADQGIEIRKTTTSDVYTVSSTLPAWRLGRSSFRNVPLQEVFAELERQYDIVVKSDIVDLNFRGSFDNNSLETAVNEIAKPLGINATISTDRKRVTFSK